jgi:hypothetical protein
VLGPTTPAGLAAWLGTTPAHAKPLWDAVRDDLTRDPRGGPPAVGRRRVSRRASADATPVVRLLPPRDPFLARLRA